MHIRQVVSARTVVEVMSGAAEPEEFQGQFCAGCTQSFDIYVVVAWCMHSLLWLIIFCDDMYNPNM